MNLKGIVSYIQRFIFWRRYSKAVEGFYQIHFIQAAAASGLLKALTVPADLSELASRLKTEHLDLLKVFCELGIKSGYICRNGDKFALSRNFARTLSNDKLDVILAYTEETITLQGTAIRDLPSCLQGSSPTAYLKGKGDLIARSSILFEPHVAKVVRAVVPSKCQIRILEVGCGSGIHLLYATERNPKITGIGIDKEKDAIELTSENLNKWGLADRFQLLNQDIFDASDKLRETFDVITLYNNIYYFTEEERIKLFKYLRSLLATQGKLAITSVMHGGHIRSVALDLLMRSSLKGAGLPVENELIEQLSSCGFHNITKMRMNPDGSYIGIIARI